MLGDWADDFVDRGHVSSIDDIKVLLNSLIEYCFYF